MFRGFFFFSSLRVLCLFATLWVMTDKGVSCKDGKFGLGKMDTFLQKLNSVRRVGLRQRSQFPTGKFQKLDFEQIKCLMKDLSSSL